MPDLDMGFKNLQSLQHIFSASQDLISLLDGEYRYVLVNDAYLKFNTIPRHEIVGKTVADILGKDIFARQVKAELDRCMAGEIVTYKAWFDYSGKGRRYMAVTYFPYRNNQQEIIGVVANGRDLTDLVTARQELRGSQEQLRLMSKSCNIGFWDWHPSTNEVCFSPGWKSQLGCGEEEIAAHYSEWENRLHPDDRERFKNDIQFFLKKNQPDCEIEYRMQHKDGSYRWILAKASVRKDENGEPGHIMGANIDITERKEKERVLQQNQEILRTVQQVAKIGSWRYEMATGRMKWTEEIFRILGREPSAAEPSYQELRDYVHPDDWDFFNTSFSRAMKDGDRYNLELRLLKPDNRICYVNLIGEPVRNSRNETIELIGTLQDITSKRLASEAIKRSEKKYSDLFESIRDAIIVADTSRYIMDCNKAFVEVFGFNKEEILGKQTSILYADDEQFRKVGEAIQEHRGEKSFILTAELRKKTKITFAAEIKVFYLKDSGGDVYGFIGFIRDISKRLDTEERVRRGQARFRSLVENLFDAVIVLNRNGMIQFVNKAACTLFERSEEELLGRDFGFPVSLDKTSKIEIMQKSGSIRYAEIKTSQADWGDEAVYLSSIRDITGNVIARLERERHQKELQRIQRLEAVGTLAGGIAHDFNNILTPILGFTELCRERTGNDEEASDFLAEVARSALRARDLIGQILAFSRQEKGSYRPILIQPIVKEVLKLIRSAIPASIEIHQDIASRGMIIGDETEIHQILMNLCTNAKHAMEDNGGILKVSLVDLIIERYAKTASPELSPGPYVKLSISDTGCGMERSVLEKIFEPYFTTKEQDKGTGLGLSVVHGIVHNHCGAITVDSEKGKGTTFDIYLPSTEKIVENIGEKEEDPPNGSEHLLVVDDEPAVLKLNRKVLENLGYQVTTRVSGLEALELFKARSEEFDLLLSDMTMPGINGDVLAAECLAIKPDLPVILITGFSERMTEKQTEEIGIRAFLLKPVPKNQLAKIVREVLDAPKFSRKEKADVG